MREAKGRTNSQKADPWGPVLPNLSSQRTVALGSLCGFSDKCGGRGGSRNAVIQPGDRSRYRLPEGGMIISFPRFTLVSMNYR